MVLIHGKEYLTVAERVNTFREQHPLWTIQSALVSADEKMVIMKSEILDDKGRVISTGYAEENRMGSKINKTSALENCETSAVGRALAFFGLAGNEIASANEVQGAMEQIPIPVDEEMALRDCKTIEDLMEAWKKVYQASKNNPEGLRYLTKVKDDMKRILSRGE